MKTQYKRFISKVNQTGSLMIEAMAMLALISLVTPTLYKKSAERTTELQDINTATHVRTIMKAVDNYVTANYQSLLEDQLRNDGATYEINLENEGASSGIHDFFPYGYKFDDLKNFGMPKVMLKRQGLSITSFVQLPKKSDIGEMRAARIASMIGSNGGYVTGSRSAQGVGGIWSLSQSDLDSLGFDTNKGSVVVASSDAINSASAGALENEKYLQRTRVDSQDQLWRNTMVTDLYMGGVTGVDDMYKILGVDQLIMGSTNTTDNTESLVLTEDARGGGSAWMAGTLSALGNAFKIEGDADNPTLNLSDPDGTIMSADSERFELYPNGADGKAGLEVNANGQTVTTDYDTTIKNNLTATGNTAVATADINTSFKAGPDGSYITAENERVLLQGGQVEILANGEGGVSATNIKTANTNITGNTKIGVGEVQPTVVTNPRLNVQGDAYVANNLEVGNTLYTQKFNAAELHAGGEAANSNDEDRWLHATRNGVTVTDPNTKNTRLIITEDETGLYSQDGRNNPESSAVVLGASGSSLRARDVVDVYTTETAGRVNLQNDALVIAGKTEGDNKADITANADTIDFNATTTSVNDGVFQVKASTDAGAENSLYVNPNTGGTNGNGLMLVEANRTTIKPRSSGTGGTFDIRDSDDKKILNVSPNGDGDEAGNPTATAYLDSKAFTLSDIGDVGHRIVEVDLNHSNLEKGTDSDARGSVYIRRGAIELESPASAGEGGFAADSGVGYIEAGRFVANTKYNGAEIDDPSKAVTDDYIGRWVDGDRVAYDRYMVNPAYTSVMHDIKLTTRGGARLSDILPDFINKGIYVVNNTYKDTGFSLDSIVAKVENGRITASSSQAKVEEVSDSGTLSGKDMWASPFMGVVPAPQCPPGHARVITITPAGFLMSQAGQMVKAEHHVASPRFVVDETQELNKLGDVVLPNAESTITGAYHTNTTFTDAAGNTKQIYYLGHATAPTATYGGAPYSPTPLYFQQSTWLKSRVQPQKGSVAGSCNPTLGSGEGCGDDFLGWSAIMGFVYPVSLYKNIIHNIIGGDMPEDGDVYWNVFPVRVKTLEAYATVYCYFDRTNLYVDPGKVGLQDQYTDKYDQLNNFRSGYKKPDNSYVKRLDDPTLGYKEPW